MKMKKFMVAALATAMTLGSVMTASAAWVQEGMNWKYQNDNGTYQTNGWFKDATNRWFHFDAAGNMQRGWYQDVDGKWYFLNFDGVMQVGLLKVDNNVYFMDEHGALFIGDRAINGTTYNFGLYGTTNGKPNVPAANTYGGNGNQALSGGGSSSGSTITTPSPVTPEKAIENVKAEAEAIKDEHKDAIKSLSVVANGNNVAVAVEAKTVTAENKASLEAAIQSSLDSVLANADDGKATVEYMGLTKDASEIEISKYLTNDMVSTNKGETATVTVKVNGEDVVYTITLN